MEGYLAVDRNRRKGKAGLPEKEQKLRRSTDQLTDVSSVQKSGRRYWKGCGKKGMEKWEIIPKW